MPVLQREALAVDLSRGERSDTAVVYFQQRFFKICYLFVEEFSLPLRWNSAQGDLDGLEIFLP